jgi:hypothetical protein
MMNCEEFELRGLDLDRADADPEEAAEAADHANRCSRCSGLLESWREVKGDLRLLRESTRTESAPMRVEMRLKQELRTRREAKVPRSTMAIAGWALAAAAVLAVSVGWVRFHSTVSIQDPTATAGSNTALSADDALLAADYDTGEFSELPGSLPSESDDQSVLQVRMQRSALSRFGLPVDPDGASDFVSVDFLVGEDGQPQAVRLHQDTQVASVTQ